MYFNRMLIAMVPDKYLILINILTHLISLYQLPLTGHGLYDWYMHILRTCFLYLISNDLVVLFLFLFLQIYNFGGGKSYFNILHYVFDTFWGGRNPALTPENKD
jgi:hypothetical protein